MKSKTSKAKGAVCRTKRRAGSQQRRVIPHHQLKVGLKAMVQGTIKGIHNGNYMEIEIHDHICGMNACTLRVHHAGVYEV